MDEKKRKLTNQEAWDEVQRQSAKEEAAIHLDCFRGRNDEEAESESPGRLDCFRGRGCARGGGE